MPRRLVSLYKASLLLLRLGVPSASSHTAFATSAIEADGILLFRSYSITGLLLCFDLTVVEEEVYQLYHLSSSYNTGVVEEVIDARYDFGPVDLVVVVVIVPVQGESLQLKPVSSTLVTVTVTSIVPVSISVPSEAFTVTM